MNDLNININGQDVKLDIPPTMLLADLLRDVLNLKSVKIGCADGECGACTVLLDGEPVASCIIPAYKAHNHCIETLEGLADSTELHPIQRAFLAEGAVQCGYCTPGMVLAAKSLLDKNPNPSNTEIRTALTGHLCRCTGYSAIIRAVNAAASAIRNGTEIALPGAEPSKTVGTSVVRKDGRAKVTGTFKYGADLELPDMLQGVLLFSKHPYARILELDTDAAERMPGVFAVLTAKDVPGGIEGIIIPDQPIFVPVGDTVRSISDVLAMVVAQDRETARKAVECIRVQYETLQGVFNPDDALSETAPVLHLREGQTKSSNVLYQTHVQKGDP